MSEYVRKQALLEWLDDRRYKSPWIESFRERLESGAFDADESEGTWKTTSEFAFRLNDQLEAEVQRLRAALGHIHAIAQSELDDLQYEGQCKTWEKPADGGRGAERRRERMIRLTNAANGKSVYINPEQLTNIEPADDVTKLELVRGVHFVTESPAEVARKVLEWRLAMEDYRHSVGEYKMLTRNVLEELAGLEEPNHD